MSRIIPRPFLIARDEDGAFRITIREMRYNSRSYPIITSTLKDDTFKSATAARAHAKEHYGAVAGEFASK